MVSAYELGAKTCVGLRRRRALRDIWTGGVLRNLDGEIVARLPGNPGGHGTTVTESGEVFIAQLSGMVQKFVKH